jgi:CMP-N-acetylneuraminic acid synthetase
MQPGRPQKKILAETKLNILAIIPARKNSKGIPNKNIADLGGIPLVAHSISSALTCHQITRTIVSTDSPEIASVAREWGAEVPFLRPKELAGDSVPLAKAFDYTCDRLRAEEGYRPDALVILLPTHPFRRPELMEELLSAMATCRIVKTVRPFRMTELSHFVPENGAVKSLHGNARSVQVCYRGYGLFYGSRLTGGFKRQFYIHVITSPPECVDIDVPEDLELANWLLRKGEFKPSCI